MTVSAALLWRAAQSLSEEAKSELEEKSYQQHFSADYWKD